MRCDDHITALQQPGRYRRFMAEDPAPAIIPFSSAATSAGSSITLPREILMRIPFSPSAASTGWLMSPWFAAVPGVQITRKSLSAARVSRSSRQA